MNSENFTAEYNELKRQTKNYYNDFVKDELLKLESKRILYVLLSLINYVLIIVFIIGYLLCWTVFFTDLPEINRIFLLILLTMLAGGLVVANISYIISINAKYKTLLKKKYNILLKPFSLTYSKRACSQNLQDCVDKSKLFAQRNGIESDDNFSGKYNDVDIEISDVKIYRSGLNPDKSLNCFDTSFISTFHGSAVVSVFNKKINSHTIIQPKHHNVSIKDRINLSIVYFIWMIFGFLVFGILGIYQGVLSQDNIPLICGIVFSGVALLFLLILYFLFAE